jgi:phosphoribosyl-dephospho-CoA transferase
VDARVFGSLAWQWLTGLNYVAPGSDVDLTWTVPRRHRIAGFLDELAALDARAPVRIDGEVLRADGAGANWRELHAGGEIALKTANDVVLVTQHAFLGAFA